MQDQDITKQDRVFVIDKNIFYQNELQLITPSDPTPGDPQHPPNPSSYSLDGYQPSIDSVSQSIPNHDGPDLAPAKKTANFIFFVNQKSGGIKGQLLLKLPELHYT
jgi:hypothetical protein